MMDAVVCVVGSGSKGRGRLMGGGQEGVGGRSSRRLRVGRRGDGVKEIEEGISIDNDLW